ncbi:MAG: MFS transporter [Pseudomonadota bacterium]
MTATAIAALLVCCTVLGLAGTDLVLPAIPTLPDILGGTITQAQWVLASFTAGTGMGLLLFGEIGARARTRPLLAGALLAYAATSAAAALAHSLALLVLLRFLQGVVAACAAVVAPGIVRALFDRQSALRAIGILGSIESLAPAIAPLIGVWLLSIGGWTASFWVTAVLAALLAFLVVLTGSRFPDLPGNRARTGYFQLLRSRIFQRYALSQGLALASLLIFVFAMPTVFVVALGNEVREFIIMQILGISCFIVAANLSSTLVQRFTTDTVIFWGGALAFTSSTAMFLYGILGGREPLVIWLLFMPMNMGYGFRGPAGFLAALEASDGDDGRASALVVLYVMLATALGTALLSPFVALGLWPAAAASVAASLISIILHRMRQGALSDD